MLLLKSFGGESAGLRKNHFFLLIKMRLVIKLRLESVITNCLEDFGLVAFIRLRLSTERFELHFEGRRDRVARFVRIRRLARGFYHLSRECDLCC